MAERENLAPFFVLKNAQPQKRLGEFFIISRLLFSILPFCIVCIKLNADSQATFCGRCPLKDRV